MRTFLSSNMKIKFLFIILINFPFLLFSQEVTFSYENFEEEFLKFNPEKLTEINEVDYQKAKDIIENTRKAVRNDPKQFSAADYFNAASTFAYLNKSQEVISLPIQKAMGIDMDKICIYSKDKDIQKFFKKNIPDLYQIIEIKCKNNKGEIKLNLKKYAIENNLSNNFELINIIDQINKNDQKDRSNNFIQLTLDKKNQVLIDSLYNKHKTYIGKSLVGEEFKSVMWKVIQHSRIDMMERYIPIIQNAVDNNELSLNLFKMLLDRFYGTKYGYQFFGTQIGFGYKMADEQTRNQILIKYGIE